MYVFGYEPDLATENREQIQKSDLQPNMADTIPTPTSIHSLSRLKLPRPNRQYHHKRTQYQRARHPRHQQNTPPTRGKFPPNHIMLGLEVSMKPNEQYEHGNPDERCAERFPYVAQFEAW